MSEVHAAIGISQIKKFSKFHKIRRRNYNYLKKLIRPIENIYLVEPRSKFLKNSISSNKFKTIPRQMNTKVTL